MINLLCIYTLLPFKMIMHVFFFSGLNNELYRWAVSGGHFTVRP